MPKKILVVDDEAQLVDMVKVRLEANNYLVLTAFDGQEGLEKACKDNPDLIILDLMLPQMDGNKVCALLKADKSDNKIPIIIFTARAQGSDIKMGEKVGAEAYITKPFEPEELIAKIKALLKE